MSGIESRQPRVDAIDKVTGRAVYAADVRTSDCLVALALRSPLAPARLKRIDVAVARVLPGVVDVFTHLDAPRLDWTSSSEIDALGAEGLGRAAMADSASAQPAYRPLIDDFIQFAGQWIAVVVAETIEVAREALGHIVFELDQLPFEPAAAIRPGAFFGADMQYGFGSDVETGPTSVSVSANYCTPMQLHQPMEPTATTAIWNDGRLTMYDSTQGVHATRAYVARSLGIPEDRVQVQAPFVGGGFGAKNQIWPHQALAAHLARALGRPVRLQLTRNDMAVASGHRSGTRQQVQLDADAQGHLTRLRHDSHVFTSLHGGFFEPCGLSSLMLYTARRIDVSHHVTRLPIPTPTPFRAPGETPGSFALETALDELAHATGLDPVELRLRNFAERDHYHGRDWSSNHLRDCYRIGAERIGWERRQAIPRSLRRDGCLVGLGMATTAYPAPALPAGVRLVLRHNGSLRVETSATDIGTGMRTLLAQNAASNLGIEISQISVHLGDSDLPEAPTAGRSKSTASVLPACADACRNLQSLLDATVGSGGTLLERMNKSGLPELTVEGRANGLSAGESHSFYSFGAHFAEVELDEKIGRLRVSRVVSVLDCGTILNPQLAESQIRGGVIFGLGMALMEEATRHPQTHRILNDNLADYAVPVHADIPPIDVVFLNKPDPIINDFGARGLGEIGLPGLAAALGNALFNATNRRARSVPFQFDILLGS